MKKITIAISFFSVLSFYSCEPRLNNIEGAEVVCFQSWGDKCKYQLSYKTGIANERIYMIDTCNKYKVGDIVHFK